MNELTKWSNLSRLAGGKMTRLTIAAPFVAFIILHNEPLQPFLDLAESRHPSPIVEVLALARFDIFYLGLLVVGTAVAIYSIFGPQQIKAHDGYDDFIEAKESTKTANGVAGSFRLTLEEFVRQTGGELPELGGNSAIGRFPRRFTEGLVSLLESLAKDAKAADTSDLGPYRDENGHIVATRIVDLLNSRRLEERGVWENLYSALTPYSIDVFRLEFLRSEYSYPKMRQFVFALLMFGMAIVLIPTLITTYLVIIDLGQALSAADSA